MRWCSYIVYNVYTAFFSGSSAASDLLGASSGFMISSSSPFPCPQLRLVQVVSFSFSSPFLSHPLPSSPILQPFLLPHLFLHLLHMHRRQTQNLTPLLLPQLRRHHPTHTRPNRLARLINQHTRIIIELDDAAIRALPFLGRSHDDGVAHVAAADFVGGGDGDGGAFGAEVALLLDYDYDAITWGVVSDLVRRQCQ